MLQDPGVKSKGVSTAVTAPLKKVESALVFDTNGSDGFEIYIHDWLNQRDFLAWQADQPTTPRGIAVTFKERSSETIDEIQRGGYQFAMVVAHNGEDIENYGLTEERILKYPAYLVASALKARGIPFFWISRCDPYSAEQSAIACPPALGGKGPIYLEGIGDRLDKVVSELHQELDRIERELVNT